MITSIQVGFFLMCGGEFPLFLWWKFLCLVNWIICSWINVSVVEYSTSRCNLKISMQNERDILCDKTVWHVNYRYDAIDRLFKLPPIQFHSQGIMGRSVVAENDISRHMLLRRVKPRTLRSLGIYLDHLLMAK